MLRISLWEETFKYLGIEQLIQSITVFDYKFEDSWMTPPVIAALEGLDKGTYLGNSVFKTEFLGIIPVDWLSGGFKNLAIIQNINPSNWEDANLDEHVNEHWGFCGSYMGPNVYRYLGPVIDNLPYDIDLVWDMPFYPEDNVAINAMIMETGVKINTWKEYHDYVLDNILFCNCSEKDKNKYIKEHQKEITSRFRG